MRVTRRGAAWFALERLYRLSLHCSMGLAGFDREPCGQSRHNEF
jgi:hypothetical protein